jgi:hypothetical protein
MTAEGQSNAEAGGRARVSAAVGVITLFIAAGFLSLRPGADSYTSSNIPSPQIPVIIRPSPAVVTQLVKDGPIVVGTWASNGAFLVITQLPPTEFELMLPGRTSWILMPKFLGPENSAPSKSQDLIDFRVPPPAIELP